MSSLYEYRKPNIKLTGAAMALILIAPQLQASDILNTINVTATRTPEKSEQSIAHTTIIDRKKIEQSQANSVEELFRLEPGVQVSRNGGYGKITSIFIRGSEANHVLILINGIRVASSTTGEYPWANLSPSQIERVEIVRGPKSSLYGSDAIGGVINIITRKTEKPYTRVTLGENSTKELNAGFGGMSDSWSYSIDLSLFDTAGTQIVEGNSTKVGYDNKNLSAGMEGLIDDLTLFNLQFTRAQGTNNNLTDTGDDNYINQVVSGRIERQMNDQWLLSLTAGHALDEYETESPTLPSTITTKRISLGLQNDIETGRGLLTAGLDYWRDHAIKDNNGLIDVTIHNIGLYAQHQWNQGDSDFQMGARYDKHDDFGNHFTWNFGWGRDLTKQTRVTASVGTAYKAPSVNDLFWPYSVDTWFGTTYITEGNTDLSAVESKSAELGITHQLNKTTEIKANLFANNIDNLIGWTSSNTAPNTYTYHPENVSEVEIRGIELTFGTKIHETRISGSLTFLDAENVSTGKQLDRRAEKSLAFYATTPLFNQGELKTEWIAASERNDNGATTKLAGYGIINLAYKHQITPELSIGGRVENLFDKDYVLASGYSGDYQTLGRTLSITLNYAPK